MSLRIAVAGARAHPTSATPAIAFGLRVGLDGGERVDAIALRCQIKIQTRKRRYSPREELDLSDLFGEPGRWGETLQPLLWTHVDATIPSFTQNAHVELVAPCSYDFDVAANKFLAALEDGEIPLLLLFSGTVFIGGERGMTVSRIPWNLEATFRLPVATFREAMNAHFPNTAWIRMRRDVFDELNRFKSAGCYASWDAAFEALLEGARETR